MQQKTTAFNRDMPTRTVMLQAYQSGPLKPFLSGSPALEVGQATRVERGKPTILAATSTPDRPLEPPPLREPDQSQAVVFSGYKLQDIADYRAALQAWFGAVMPYGYLVIVVPHAFLFDRQTGLPTRWQSTHRRLYTPASLLEEVEEALVPNTYRVRYLGDDDAGYVYGLDRDDFPVGQHDILLALQRIAPPAWTLGPDRPAEVFPLDYSFEKHVTRIERDAAAPCRKILILKLDHLGDFIMGVPALENARAAFSEAEITLVVGSWNHAMALELGIFEHVIAFDVFPRNSSEEVPNVLARVAAFNRLITGNYDIAIDLRTDADTRVLLKDIHARVKAGIGTKVQFSYLDIFLPIDRSRGSEGARDEEIPARDFSAQPFCNRNRFQISCKGNLVERDVGAIIWGPYRSLAAGRYIFEPFIELDPTTPGLIECDVAVDRKRLLGRVVSDTSALRMQFAIDDDDSVFEFRIWSQPDEPVPNFQFYGGRLIKQGASSVLHQSEYLSLLIELVSMRVDRYGALRQGQPLS